MGRRLLSHSNNFNTFPQKLLLKWKHFANKAFSAKPSNYAKSGFSNAITLLQKNALSGPPVKAILCLNQPTLIPLGCGCAQLRHKGVTQHPISHQLWVLVSWCSSCFMWREQSLSQRLAKLNISCGLSAGLSWEILSFRSVFGSIIKPGEESRMIFQETETSSPTS